MKRREFTIGLLTGAAAAWSQVARAQRPPGRRRLGVLMAYAENDPEYRSLVAAFMEELQKLGWVADRNIRVEYRWAAGDTGRMQQFAAELAGLKPDVILATSPPALEALKSKTKEIPIVFLNVADPVGAGLVQSLARPGNITGVTNFEYTMGGKWLALLKEIVPSIDRVMVLLAPAHITNAGLLRAIEAVALSSKVQLTPLPARDAGEIERAMAAFARRSSGGLIVLPNPVTTVHRKLIVSLAATYRLHAIYPFRFFAMAGGLMSYGVETIGQWRQVAGYVDRILCGAKPADLPVQAPTKFELVLNFKTAKALGLNIPPAFLGRADEVIE